ncbi:MAG TPA: histidine phosphatase family protein [Hyphomicrobiaceae bacterium]|nr:histidine phosphatase family protein [Hyphomicrobiaceae bacterium]
MVKMPIIYFVRHGETDWNVAKRYQGQTDTPLNDHGRGQAARNGRALKELLGSKAAALDYVASPLSRTAETMTIIRREIGLEPDGFRRDDRLKEIHFGHWEGRVWYDLPAEDPEGFAGRKADPWSWRPRQGESYAMLSARVAGWLEGVREPTIAVSHGGVSRVLRGLLLGLTPHDITDLEVPQDKLMVIENGKLAWV